MVGPVRFEKQKNRRAGNTTPYPRQREQRDYPRVPTTWRRAGTPQRHQTTDPNTPATRYRGANSSASRYHRQYDQRAEVPATRCRGANSSAPRPRQTVADANTRRLNNVFLEMVVPGPLSPLSTSDGEGTMHPTPAGQGGSNDVNMAAAPVAQSGSHSANMDISNGLPDQHQPGSSRQPKEPRVGEVEVANEPLVGDVEVANEPPVGDGEVTNEPPVGDGEVANEPPIGDGEVANEPPIREVEVANELLNESLEEDNMFHFMVEWKARLCAQLEEGNRIDAVLRREAEELRRQLNVVEAGIVQNARTLEHLRNRLVRYIDLFRE